jgi:hypothetical protein
MHGDALRSAAHASAQCMGSSALASRRILLCNAYARKRSATECASLSAGRFGCMQLSLQEHCGCRRGESAAETRCTACNDHPSALVALASWE